MPLTIRPVEQSDIPALSRICFDAFGSLHDRHAIERDFDSIDTATMVIAMCATRPDFAGFVAEAHGPYRAPTGAWLPAIGM